MYTVIVYYTVKKYINSIQQLFSTAKGGELKMTDKKMKEAAEMARMIKQADLTEYDLGVIRGLTVNPEIMKRVEEVKEAKEKKDKEVV